MLAVVMEPALRDTKSWTGVVAAKLGTSLYCDCSDNESTPSFASKVKQLADEIYHRSHASALLPPSSAQLSRSGANRLSVGVVGTSSIAPDVPADAPLSHFWTATSHSSSIVGDQLTGRSTADSLRRQLLQVL
eukprot:2893326-Prymnesium_polylepis.2